MSSPTRTARQARIIVPLACCLLAVGLAGCGQADGPAGGSAAASFGRDDVVAAVREDPASAALLPADVRASGTLRFGSAIGAAPIAFYAGDDKTPLGVDIDISYAVGKVLGLRIDRTKVSGPAILTGLLSDRFQIATADFAVTTDRMKVLDFVTYEHDGTAFITTKTNALRAINQVDQLCGLRIGTGIGTTFDQQLTQDAGTCAQHGRPVYQVNTYSDAAGQLLALKEGRIDVLMNGTSALRYMVSQQPDLRYLGQYGQKDIGFGLKKGSPLAPALAAAVNRLIWTGVYARIIDKWHLGGAAAISASQIDPKQPPN